MFDFLADGHRLPDDMTPVGRGWLDTANHFDDWLVTATQVEIFDVPEPTSVALFLMAIVPLCCLRRRA